MSMINITGYQMEFWTKKMEGNYCIFTATRNVKKVLLVSWLSDKLKAVLRLIHFCTYGKVTFKF